jgi:hypothetical protein
MGVFTVEKIHYIFWVHGMVRFSSSEGNELIFRPKEVDPKRSHVEGRTGKKIML